MKLEDIYNEKMKEKGLNIRVEGYKEERPHYLLIILLVVAILGLPNYFLIYNSGNACFAHASASFQNSTSVVSNAVGLGCGVDFTLYIFATVLELLIIALLLLKFVRYRKITRKI